MPFPQRFARKVEDEGVTVAEWVFMRSLYDDEGIAPSALAARMGMTRGAISKLADRLVEKDLVAREAGDGRGQILTLRLEARVLVRGWPNSPIGTRRNSSAGSPIPSGSASSACCANLHWTGG